MKKLLITALALSLGVILVQAAEGDPKPKPTPPPAGAQPTLPDWVKKYDKNGDGKLDEQERMALQKERQAEMLKKYDKNGDGKIDETERQAMMDDRKKEREAAIAKREGNLKKKLEEKKPEEKK